MKRILVWICLIVLLLRYLDIEIFSEWLQRLEWEVMKLTDAIPLIHEISIFQLAILIILFIVALDSAGGKSTVVSGLFKLRKHQHNSEDNVLNIISRGAKGMKADTNDYMSDICFVERRFNSWLLIILVMLVLLAPAFYLVAQDDAQVMSIPFFALAIILLFVLLRGRLTVGTADGDVMSVMTNKLTADNVCETIAEADPKGFHQVDISSAFSERKLHMRKAKITGVVALSRFPLLLFLIMVLTAIGAITVFERAPFGLVIPIVLLIIVIILAQKHTTVKLIGGHYCHLGSRYNVDSILKAATPEK